MIVAPQPNDEDDRLKALWNYEILDTGAEACFDEIVELASAICNVPIALVSLVDQDRQWFKAKVGLAAEETSRDLAFCAHAIHHSEPLIVEDALDDERFCDNPLVVGDPGIRFYAGAPLNTPDGYRIGTLCAIDTQPKTLTPYQLRQLQLMSKHVVSMLELRAHYRDSLTLANELSVSKKQVLEMSEHNQRFLASLNHDMRTPLNAIIGFSDRLSQRLSKMEIAPFVIEGVNAIQVASRQLNHLVGEVLSISKLDAGKMQRKDAPFDPAAILNEVFLINSEYARAHDVTLTLELKTELPPLVLGDERKVSQILTNVISNATKYTPDHKRVWVEAGYTDGELQVTVRDEGVGIAPKDLQRIFGEFEQIDNPLSDRVQGTGLGLAIVKRLLTLLGASIKVESELYKGSKFSISFPLPIAKNQ